MGEGRQTLIAGNDAGTRHVPVRGEVAKEIARDTGAQGSLKQQGPTWEAASWVGNPPDTLWSRTHSLHTRTASGSPASHTFADFHPHVTGFAQIFTPTSPSHPKICFARDL